MMKRYTISIDADLGDWIERLVESKRFRNVSHGFEFCANEVRKIEFDKHLDEVNRKARENLKYDTKDTNQPVITRENILEHIEGYINEDEEDDDDVVYNESYLKEHPELIKHK